MWGVSLTQPMLILFLCGEFLLHIPCCLHFYLGSFSYTYHAAFVFIWGVSLTHPVLASLLCGEFLLHIPRFILCRNFLLHIPCCLHFYEGSFSYTSRAVLIFMQVVSLAHPMLACSFCIWELLCGDFLLHIPFWLHFYLGSFSYTSRAGFIFMQRVSLTHPMLFFNFI